MRILQIILSILAAFDFIYGAETPMISEIDSGKTALVQYSICKFNREKKTDDLNLIVLIKNIGAKHISLKGKDVPGLSIFDKNGKEVLYSTETDPVGLHLGGSAVFHISVNGHNLVEFPWQLRFENADGFTPFTISSIINQD